MFIGIVRALMGTPTPAPARFTEDPFEGAPDGYVPTHTAEVTHETYRLEVPADTLPRVRADLRKQGDWLMQSSPVTRMGESLYVLTVMKDGLKG